MKELKFIGALLASIWGWLYLLVMLLGILTIDQPHPMSSVIRHVIGAPFGWAIQGSFGGDMGLFTLMLIVPLGCLIVIPITIFYKFYSIWRFKSWRHPRGPVWRGYLLWQGLIGTFGYMFILSIILLMQLFQ